MRSGFRATFVVVLLSTSACSQPAAHVELKGQQVFAQNGAQYAQYIPSAGKYTTPSKYTAPISMGTVQAADVSSISVSDLGTPSASVQTKNLEPVKIITAEPVKTIPQPEQKSAVVQAINPWTKKPRTEFIKAKAAEPVAKAKPVTLASDNGNKASFIWPVNGSKILSGYGPKGGGKINDGINIAAAEGEPVWAAADGEIVYVGNELQGYGNMVLIKHASGKTTTYAHLSQSTVDKYDRVHQGDIIGYVGSTGSVKKPQLHFAVRDGDNFVDPMKFVSRSVASN
jgi:murein DD-endopeptidase MepM/ murein hydrolase activator NlpD